jgi:ABC-type transport system involved in cytochrome c biogenesis permease subunit
VIEAVRDPFLPVAALAGVFLLLGAALMCRGCFASGCGAAAQVEPRRSVAGMIVGVARFAVAAAVVMLPLFIAGRVLLVKELVPALQSPLLVPHVGAYIISYAILIFAAFGIGRRFVPFGFFLMTLALVLGALWGKICWGDWWQYDPKEMWSLGTWLTFAAWFHFRGNETASRWLLRFGAVMIILTLTWVNFSKLFKGLHSYV